MIHQSIGSKSQKALIRCPPITKNYLLFLLLKRKLVSLRFLVHCPLSRNMWQRNCFSSQATEQSVTLGRSFIFTTDLAQQLNKLKLWICPKAGCVSNSETGHRSDPDFGTKKWLKQFSGEICRAWWMGGGSVTTVENWLRSWMVDEVGSVERFLFNKQ